MERQCAGCGTVFEDGTEPLGPVSPRPHGCCAECNKHTFRSQERELITGPSGGKVSALVDVAPDLGKGTATEPEKPLDSEEQVS